MLTLLVGTVYVVQYRGMNVSSWIFEAYEHSEGWSPFGLVALTAIGQACRPLVSPTLIQVTTDSGWSTLLLALHMQLDDRCMFAAFHLRAKDLSSLHMLRKGMVSQKFQPGTPPPCPPRPSG